MCPLHFNRKYLCPCLQYLHQDREHCHPPRTFPPASPSCPWSGCRPELSYQEFCLVLNVQHSVCALVSWLLLFSLRWSTGATGSFPDLTLPPVDIGGLQGLVPKNKAAGIPLSGS